MSSLAAGPANVREDGDPRYFAGQRIGRFELECPVGVGGMGVVFSAIDPLLRRRVAIKLLRLDLVADRPMAKERLLRESRALAQLNHPNVVTLYEAGVHDEEIYLAMELVAGTTLADWPDSRTGWREIVRVFVQIGRGLAAAHAIGLVHRDVKPANMLLSDDGRARIGDFGVVGLTGENDQPPVSLPIVDNYDRHTRAGAVPGTPGYIAPEVRAGAPATPSSDQWSYATALWMILGGDHATSRAPRWLRAAVARGRAEDAADRWPSMDAMVAALVRRTRRPSWAGIAVPLGVVLAAGALTVRAFALHEHAAWSPSVVDLPPFIENSDTAWFSPDGSSIAYPSDRAQHDMFRVYVSPLHGADARVVTPPDISARVDGWTRDGAALLLFGFRDGHLWSQPVSGAPATDLGLGRAMTPCGDGLLVVERPSESERMTLWRDGRRETVFEATGDFEDLWSPQCDREGQRVVFLGGAVTPDRFGRDLYLIDLRDPARRPEQLTTGHMSGAATFVPDGRSIVYAATRDGTHALYELTLADHSIHALTAGTDDAAPVVSPDGHSLLFLHDITAEVVYVGDRRSARKLTTQLENIFYVKPMPDGATLVAERDTVRGSDVIAIDVATGSERTLAHGRSPFPSLDGKRVMYRDALSPGRLESVALSDGTTRTIVELSGEIYRGYDGGDGVHLELRRGTKFEGWVVHVDGSVAPEGVAGLVVPSPDGGWRAVMSFRDNRHTLRLVPPGASLATGRELHVRGEVTTWLDTRRLSYSDGGSIHVVDVTTGQEVDHLAGRASTSGLKLVLASDGEHWFDVGTEGRTTRHLITNFGDRPWK